MAVIVNPATHQAIGADVGAFTASMTAVGKRGILVLDRWGHPDAVLQDFQALDTCREFLAGEPEAGVRNELQKTLNRLQDK